MVMPDELPATLRALEQAGIEYVLTGSLASTTWGRPRATYDVDLVVDLRAGDVEKLLRAFPAPAWYLERDAILEALRTGGEFNAIHGATGTKLDFWLKSRRPADVSRFLRRRREELAGVPCWVLSPEDTVLAKLEWLRAAPSERQQADVVGILTVQGDQLDFGYLRQSADQLGVRDLLEEALSGRWG
jgi:hypothetical protein